jgi:lysophospholipid acyltransferase (LPLAT)-like uncharacterized protein
MKTSFVQNAIALISVTYLLIVRWTCVWRRTGFHHIQPYWAKKRPVIVVFWHNRMAMAPFAWRSRTPFYMLISHHSDGRLISRIVKKLGIHTVQGTTSHQKGGSAVRGLIRCLKEGGSVGITPDGPRGPCEVLKEGVFMVSLLSGCDVLAVSFVTSRNVRLSSWDRFFVPLPFGKGGFYWSHPVAAPTSAEEKDIFLGKVQKAMDSVTYESLGEK